MTQKNQKLAGYIAITAFVYSLCGLVGALILYWLEDFSYMPWSNYISDLSVGPNNSSVVYHIMLVGFGILTIPFVILYQKFLSEKGGNKITINVILISGLLCAICLILMSLYPLDFSEPTTAKIHLAFGISLFINLGILMGGIGLNNQKFEIGPKFLNLIAIISGIFNLLFGILLFSVEIISILNRHTLVYLIEWIGFFSFAIWLVITGFLLIKEKI